MLLSGRVVQQRVKHDKFVGEQSGQPTSEENGDPLAIAARCHHNFVENVPIALLLAAVVELNGGNRKVLNGSLGALLVVRILHVELGLRGPKSLSNGRPIGYFGTLGFLGGMAGYAAYLVKGYWGF